MSQLSILPANPGAGYQRHKKELLDAIGRVLERGTFILGQEVSAFEQEFAAYIGVRYGIGVANGTDALHIALRSVGIAPGDEVITVSHTAVATVAAIEMAGATPVLVDVIPESMTIDPEQVRSAVTKKTKAILPVHLYGLPADMTAIRSIANQYGLKIVEDCAQSHGAKYGNKRTGSHGDVSAFSFYPTKNLGALGDGGAILTDDPAVAERARLLREYGWRQRYISEISGFNSRLDEVQAAILRVMLRHLDESNSARQSIATIYDGTLHGTSLALPSRSFDCEPVVHQYVVRHDRRDELREHLKLHGIGTLIHYPVPIHLQPAYTNRVRILGDLPHTRRASATVLSLPLYPELGLDQVRRTADVIVKWASH